MSRFQFFAPSPRAGEGWGEAAMAIVVTGWSLCDAHPSP